MLKFPQNSYIHFTERNQTFGGDDLQTPDNITTDKELLNINSNINLEGRQLFAFQDGVASNSQFICDNSYSISDIYIENRYGQKIISAAKTENVSPVDSTLKYIDFNFTPVKSWGLVRVVISVVKSSITYVFESQYFNIVSLSGASEYGQLKYRSEGVRYGFNFDYSSLSVICAKISFIKESPLVAIVTTSQDKNSSYIVSNSYRRQLQYSAELSGSDEAARLMCILTNDVVYLNNDKMIIEKFEPSDAGKNNRLTTLNFTISLTDTGDYYSTANSSAPKDKLVYDENDNPIIYGSNGENINYH